MNTYRIEEFDAWPFNFRVLLGDDLIFTQGRVFYSTRDTLETVRKHPANIEQMNLVGTLVRLANERLAETTK